MDIRDTIDAYVKGHMQDAEKTAFESALQQDPALAQAVDQARLDLQLSNQLIENEIRGWMQEWETAPVPPENPAKPVSNNLKWWAASALVVLVGAGVWYVTRPSATPLDEKEEHISPPQQRGNRPDVPVVQQETTHPASQPIPEKSAAPATDPRLIALAESNFNRYDQASIKRNTNAAQPADTTVLQKAAAAMNKRAYAQAIRMLRAVPATDREYMSAQVLLGENYFLQKQYDRAQQAYTTALQSNKISADAVEWNLLMTYLAQYAVQKDNFDLLLEKILADTEHPDHDKAVNLKKALKK